MPGQIIGRPSASYSPDGGVDVTWDAEIPEGETVLYFTVNIYSWPSGQLVTSIELTP